MTSAARLSQAWNHAPALPRTHYVDNRVYVDPSVFDREQARVFGKVWKLVCHESELPAAGDYRVFQIAGHQIVVVRGQDGALRSFFNTCPHRGAELVRHKRGTLKRGFECFYHRWNFDLDGGCLSMTRSEGYASVGLTRRDVGLRKVRTEIACGFVFLSLDDDIEPLQSYLNDVLPHIATHLGSIELEVIHYHSAIVHANCKLWNEHNSEAYHEFLHVLNRRTALANPAYHQRKMHLFHNSHCMLDQLELNYQAMHFDTRDEHRFPGMLPNGIFVTNLFPDSMMLIRSTVMRMDTVTPLSPSQTLVEWRGLGIKGDTPQVREMRIRHHNQVWGPAGANLPEDIAAVESQYRNIAAGSSRWSLFAREEEMHPQDDSNIRSWYREWGRRVGLDPSDIGACSRPIHSEATL